MGKPGRLWTVVGALIAAAVGVLLALTTVASASSTATVSPRDNCGGFNGHVVWSGSVIQLYGEVWDTTCSGSTSVWLAWDSPSYHNVETGSATDPNTVGVNYKTATQQTPDSITVTVCSTNGGWHCGAGTYVNQGPPPGRTTTTTTTIVTPPPTTTTTTTTIVTTPVPIRVPEPSRRSRALRAKLRLGWTWNRASTWLRTVALGRIPAHTRLVASCAGRGCPRPVVARVSGARSVRRLLRRLEGRRYRAGDRLLLRFQAPGLRPERAQVTMRWGRLPAVRLLRS
jgi:hypothetical protein